jgi:hypothetical protein
MSCEYQALPITQAINCLVKYLYKDLTDKEIYFAEQVETLQHAVTTDFLMETLSSQIADLLVPAYKVDVLWSIEAFSTHIQSLNAHLKTGIINLAASKKKVWQNEDAILAMVKFYIFS